MNKLKRKVRAVSSTLVFVFVLLVSAKDSNATFISPKYEAQLLMSLEKVNCNNFKKSDIACLACNVYFEARSKSTKLQEGVAIVTINRTKSRRFPNTICGVVWDKYQFSWTLRRHKNVEEMKEWTNAIKTSVRVTNDIEGTTRRLKLNDKVVYFHDKTVKPTWTKEMRVLGVFDNHRFYEMNKTK